MYNKLLGFCRQGHHIAIFSSDAMMSSWRGIWQDLLLLFVLWVGWVEQLFYDPIRYSPSPFQSHFEIWFISVSICQKVRSPRQQHKGCPEPRCCVLGRWGVAIQGQLPTASVLCESNNGVLVVFKVVNSVIICTVLLLYYDIIIHLRVCHLIQPFT